MTPRIHLATLIALPLIVAPLIVAACTNGKVDPAKVASAEQQASVILTATAAGMCKAQAAANTAKGIAQSLGDTDAANRASAASAVLGLGCLWTAATTPAPAAPAQPAKS